VIPIVSHHRKELVCLEETQKTARAASTHLAMLHIHQELTEEVDPWAITNAQRK